ncbi:hypothetical protein N8I77_002252 [Diaporthe amygdali]|uniref:Lysophospholipase A n=1 Tax=Phomopsis amygdali TaxID=1214568 RepID=A0AAD9STR9_PHOAM|nr:hypothetical protein N8I77_002252 [Diaporthe amygdali]
MSMVVGSAVPPVPFQWQNVKHLIAFGDSYTYVQGVQGHQNYSFIGDYLLGNFAYDAETLLTNQIVQNFTGTAEGGPNWVEYLTGCGQEPGLTSPLSCDLQLWDFAFAGADVSTEFTPLHHNFTVPLVNQTQQFLTYGQPVFENELQVSASETLVAIWIGINDINDLSKTYSGAYDFPSTFNSIISTIFSQSVTPLFEAGYNNFLFINLPPLDRTPGNAKTASPSPNETMIGWWGDTLQQYSDDFSKQNAGTTTMVFDANTFLNGVLDSASEYGITNTTDYCAGYLYADVLTDWEKYGCSGPLDTYFWFNSGHMTSRVHEILAPEVAKFLSA